MFFRKSSTKENQPVVAPAASPQIDLSEIPTEQLLKEIERRLNCLNKPDRRLILIGMVIEWFVWTLRMIFGLLGGN